MAPKLSAVVDRATRTGSASSRATAARADKKHRYRIVATIAGFAAILTPTPLLAQSSNVRLTKLSDVAFGAITNVEADAVSSQSVCVYANTANRGYQVTASGSAAGGAFALTSGSSLLDYEVQWNQSSSQSSGAQLNPNVTLTGQVSSATQQSCNAGPATTASLILILRSSALSSARAGSYAGTLTLLVGPE